MFSLAAGMQCDFGSYLFTRGQDRRGWKDETEWEKKTQKEGEAVKKNTKEAWSGSRRERGTLREGNRCQEA